MIIMSNESLIRLSNDFDRRNKNLELSELVDIKSLTRQKSLNDMFDSIQTVIYTKEEQEYP